MSTKVRYRLGLDLGTSSVAMAAFRLDESGKPSGVLAIDSTIFFEPVEPKTLTLSNEIRRTKRLMRRQLARKKSRTRKLLHLAKMLGVDTSALRAASESLSNTPEVWRLRSEALDKPLTLAQLMLVLLRISKNRGYKGVKPTAKGSKLAKGLTDSESVVQKYQARTLGEALWKRHAADRRNGFRKLTHETRGAQTVAGTFALRESIEAEFDQIMAVQAQANPILAAPLQDAFGPEGLKLLRDGSNYFFGLKPVNMVEALRFAIFHQRPLPSFEARIGRCPHVAGEYRVGTAHPSFQRFRLARTIADLSWREGRKEIPLDDAHKQVIRTLLLQNSEIDFRDVYRALEDHGCMRDGARLNLHTARMVALRGDVLRAAWRKQKVLGEWDALNPETQGRVIEILTDALPSPEHWTIPEKREQIRDRFGSEACDFLNLLADDDGQLGHLAAYGLPRGRAAYGRTACERLAEALENGAPSEHDAVRAVFTKAEGVESEVPLSRTLPDPSTLDVTSPLVKRALRETHRALSAFFDRYGPPAEMVVELMREVRQSLEQRRETSLRQRQREAERTRGIKALKEAGFSDSPSNVKRYLLWKEQAEYCPYSGQRLNLSDALDKSQTHFEHILPAKLRGIGNRMDQMVLAKASFNSLKGDETPWAAAHDQKNAGKWDWDATVGCCKAIVKANPKFRRKAQTIVNPISAKDSVEDLEEFVDRQFSDAAWIAKTVHGWCRTVCPDVTVIRGSLTARLRNEWGLDTVLAQVREDEGKHSQPKARELFFEEGPRGPRFDKRCDHRHHIVDAAVIGLSTRSLYRREIEQRRAAERGRKASGAAAIEVPVNGLRQVLIDRLTGYVPWRKPDRLLSGRLFDEEAFSLGVNNSLSKRGEVSKRSFRPRYDRIIQHSDRHGRQHSKALVSAEHACLQLKDNGWTLLTLEQFTAAGYVREGRVVLPSGVRLFFKGDIVYSPRVKKFLCVATLSEQSGLMCIEPSETHTFDDLKGTGLNIRIGTVKDLDALVRLQSKRHLGGFLATIRDGT